MTINKGSERQEGTLYWIKWNHRNYKGNYKQIKKIKEVNGIENDRCKGHPRSHRNKMQTTMKEIERMSKTNYEATEDHRNQRRSKTTWTKNEGNQIKSKNKGD